MSIRLGATKDTILCALSPYTEEGRDGTIKICLVFYTQSVLAGDFLVDFFAHVRSRRLKKKTSKAQTLTVNCAE